jgi:HAD superfamily phosphoserine phosphatase-like hydrolase
VKPTPGRWAAVSDFDGTITTFDVGDALLLRCGAADRAAIEASYAPGVKVTEHMRRSFAACGLTPGRIQDFARRSVKPRRGFPAFAAACAAAGAPLVVVSGGIDLYAGPFFEKLGIRPDKVYIGRGRAAAKGIRLSYPFLRGLGLPAFKAARVKALKRAGYAVAFFGDGPSDLPAARAADRVFAAGRLLALCRREGLAAEPLTDFRRAAALFKREAACTR